MYEDENEVQIPLGCVQWGQSATYIDTQIPEGSYLRCFPAELFSPSDFNVNLTETWFQLEILMSQIQDTMEEWLGDYELLCRCTPRLHFLTPGLIVLCKYFGPKDKRPEWHRAMVLENPAYVDHSGTISQSRVLSQSDTEEVNQTRLTVKLLDYGTIHETTITSIKYMPKHFLNLPIQAIECQMLFQDQLEVTLAKRNYRWPAAASDKLFDLCEGKFLGVTFLKRKQVWSLPGTDEISHGKWIVSVDLIEGEKSLSNVIDSSKSKVEVIPKGNWFDPERQREAERRHLARTLDPSLTRHPDGYFSNLVATENHNLSIYFIKWILEDSKREK